MWSQLTQALSWKVFHTVWRWVSWLSVSQYMYGISIRPVNSKPGRVLFLE